MFLLPNASHKKQVWQDSFARFLKTHVQQFAMWRGFVKGSPVLQNLCLPGRWRFLDEPAGRQFQWGGLPCGRSMSRLSRLCRFRNQLQDSAASFQEALQAWRQGRWTLALFLRGEAEPSTRTWCRFFLQSSANKLTSPFSLSTGCWSQQLSPVGTGGKPADSLEKVPAAKVWLYPTGSGGRFEMMESNHHWYYQDLKRDRYIFFSFTWWICTGFCRILLDDVGRQRSKPGTCLGFSMFTSCLSVSAQRIALPCRCRACCVPLLVTSQSLRSLDRRKHTRKVARREPECGNVRQTKLCCAQCWNLCCQSQFSFRLGLCACQMQTSRTEMILIWWDALQKNFLSTAGLAFPQEG